MSYQPPLPFEDSGLYDKYVVYKKDGPIETLVEDFVFVLKPYTDPAAANALQAYMVSCMSKRPSLARDLAPIAEECLDIHFRETREATDWPDRG